MYHAAKIVVYIKMHRGTAVMTHTINSHAAFCFCLYNWRLKHSPHKIQHPAHYFNVMNEDEIAKSSKLCLWSSAVFAN